MAVLTLNIPNAQVPLVLRVATARLTSLGIDMTGMTQTQIVQRYLVEHIRADYVAQANADAVASSSDTIAAATAQAKIDAQGIA